MRVLTIASQRGNVGKSVTAAAVAQVLVARGYRTLAIDLDPQADMSRLYSVDADRDSLPSSYDLFKGSPLAQTIVSTRLGDIVPATIDLSSADVDFTSMGRERMLRDALETVESSYDFVVIDTPPNLGVLTWNAFVASDGLVVPVSLQLLKARDLSLLLETVRMVRRTFRPSLKVYGTLLSRFDTKADIDVQGGRSIVAEMAQGQLGEVFNTVIREGSVVKEAGVIARVPHDYTDFVDELLSKMNDANTRV